MKYDINWLISKAENGERLKYLFFWGHQPSRDGSITASCFSQWWPAQFTVEGQNYKSAEHYMMAQKAKLFDDHSSFWKILLCDKPAEAKELGRQVKNFNETRWLQHRYEIVLQGSIHKFKQNESLKAFLLNTNDRVIVEASPVDRIWGIGLTADSKNVENPAKWNGLNLLGFALMEARYVLRGKKFNVT
jgi:ribA/ribD-fused uncharacterized protein